MFNSYITKILNETNVAEKNEDAVALAMLQVTFIEIVARVISLQIS